MEDPYRGSTEEQDRAYRNLERITCTDTKDLWRFLNEFRILASKSGRLFFPATTDKFFTKLRPIISKRIEEAFRNKYPGLTAGVLPAIKFMHTYISEMCTEVALQKELRDLSLCSAIPIPGYYEKTGKMYGIRKSKTYKGKPHDKTHVKVFKRKYKEDRGRVSKCKCYICGREGHFARDYRRKTGNIARRAVIDNLDLKEDWDIISADVSDQDTVYSISEGGGATTLNIGSMIEDSPPEENAFIIQEEYCFMFHPESTEDIHKRVQEAGSWRPYINMPETSKNCVHEWQENGITSYTFCHYCGIATSEISRLHCTKCKLTACVLCALHHLKKKVEVKRKEPDVTGTQALIEDEVYTAKKTDEGEQTKVCKIINNQLYNVEVEFDIPNIKLFKVKAIIDTGATSCCINKSTVPVSSLETIERTVYFNGLNSRQPSNQKMKARNFRIEGNKFRIPLIYALEMITGDYIDMLIGTNFTRSMNGGIRIEGDEVTLYKKVTRLKANQTTEVNMTAIEELDMDEEFYQELQETVFFSKQDSEKLKARFKPILKELREQGYIGEEPLKHWRKNGETCRLDIINPDVTIQDKPLKHVTPALEASFQKHVDALLKLGVIRPSKSKHRTMAMMVNSGTTVDPAT
ncbi:hypothetical protein L1987_52879 [Smallanthus sonchifolius]|uniref:Uncharacterized protein n=1 Tax=Smallanthus sonchifolius TaxID=185202 RepID=A0ACB9EU11_9ASTR|nr:hypothetical protein L1987_52879 [Smallanthus sonchifolius]